MQAFRSQCFGSGCERRSHARGLCQKHYKRLIRNGDPEVRTSRLNYVRFLKYVSVRKDGCWEWLGWKNIDGYGRFKVSGKKVLAHRFSYRLFIGEIPSELSLDHQCNHVWCVNPKHLKPMSIRENILRGNGPTAKNSRKTHCHLGHLLPTSRLCSVCDAERKRKWETNRKYRSKCSPVAFKEEFWKIVQKST